MCPVCLDGFKDPKTLSCLHTFCTNCLENCKRAYRRDVTCPVCKKVTVLTPLGISGLQNDFRIQQIKDILLCSSPTQEMDDDSQQGDDSKPCDLCKSQGKRSNAQSHCIQCFMYFCSACNEKHSVNALFRNHHVINMAESRAAKTLFCKSHKEHPVRYFCSRCNIMLCTICTIDHDPSHVPQPLEKGIIDQYKQDLQESLKTVKHKLSELKCRTKYLETVREGYQKALYESQAAIKSRAESIVKQVKSEESRLLQEVQNIYDSKIKQNGVENLGDYKFHKYNIEQTYAEIQSVVKGTPQQCLVAYEDLKTRLQSVTQAQLPDVQTTKSNEFVKFVPLNVDMDVMIGSLQECTISDISEDTMVSKRKINVEASQQSEGFSSQPTSPVANKKHRVNTILGAISPAKKIGKVKAFNHRSEKISTSPTTISADDLGITSAMDSSAAPPASPRASSSSPIAHVNTRSAAASASKNAATPLSKPQLVFTVDQVGGWPGKVTSPSGVAFLRDGTVIVAECESRLQLFNNEGQSIRIIGWGKVKPQRVAVAPDGKILITDNKDNCIRVFNSEGESCGVWGIGVFGIPNGVAVMSSGNVVVTDVERHTVSIHSPDGSLLSMFGSWGSAEYLFNNPTHVAIGQNDNILVSDSGNSCIKVYNQTGKFIRQFSLTSGKQAQIRRPQGLTTDSAGNIYVADRDNHRITMFNSDGRFLRHVLSKNDGLKYPCDIELHADGSMAVVESHASFLVKDPHHAVKLFK